MEHIWTQIKVKGKREDLERISAIMSMLDPGLMIEDYGDFEQNNIYGELVDETILNADKDSVYVSLFVPEEKSVAEYTAFLRERFSYSEIAYEMTFCGCREEDWANSYKKYYKPVEIGKITIVPAWEDYTTRPGEIIVRMDPGMAFGTGTHETTRLMIRLLQDYVKEGDTMLDVGCGSGILSICASKLGASYCFACDLDPVAVRVAKENIASSGEKNIECGTSDLLKQSKGVPGGYKVIAANIVADIIVRLTPDVSGFLGEDGVYLLSGIVEGSAEKVLLNLAEYGYEIIKEYEENGWRAYAARRKKD